MRKPTAIYCSTKHNNESRHNDLSWHSQDTKKSQREREKKTIWKTFYTDLKKNNLKNFLQTLNDFKCFEWHSHFLWNHLKHVINSEQFPSYCVLLVFFKKKNFISFGFKLSKESEMAKQQTQQGGISQNKKVIFFYFFVSQKSDVTPNWRHIVN